MPIVKTPKEAEPPWKDWDRRAQKKGIHHTVYSVNGDQYTGDWLDNKKDGKYIIIKDGTHKSHIVPGLGQLIHNWTAILTLAALP